MSKSTAPIARFFPSAVSRIRPPAPEDNSKSKPSMLTDTVPKREKSPSPPLEPIYEIEPAEPGPECTVHLIDIQRLRQQYGISEYIQLPKGRQRKATNRELCTKIMQKQVEMPKLRKPKPIQRYEVAEPQKKVTKRVVKKQTAVEKEAIVPPKYDIQGYWENKSGKSLESTFYWNRLGDIILHDPPPRNSEANLANMIDNDNSHKSKLINLFVWQTIEEFEVLKKYHGDNVTHQSLWQLPYDILWPKEFRDANPQHEREFEKLRKRFLREHVKAIWPMENGKTYLVHLHSEDALENYPPYDEHERLSSGFIRMPADFDMDFFTSEHAKELQALAQIDGYTYPWTTGDEGWDLIQKYGKDETMTVAMLAKQLRKKSATQSKEISATNSQTKTTRKVGFITDKRMLEHKCACAHVENPKRLRDVTDALDKLDLISLQSHEATDAELATCHNVEAIIQQMQEILKTQIEKETIKVDNNKDEEDKQGEDMYVVPEKTLLAARLAAGCSIALVKNIIEGKVESGFAAVRPPGHHAHRNFAAGFCFFNNATLAAVYAANQGYRVLIIDVDYHFGDGTEDIFIREKSPNLACVSIHRNDAYPPPERGLSKTSSNDPRIRNFGYDGTRTDKYYIDTFTKEIVPFGKEFKPDIIVISAGFDAAKGDKLGESAVTVNGYRQIIRLIKSITPKIAMVLEGGYSGKPLANSATACVEVLLE